MFGNSLRRLRENCGLSALPDNIEVPPLGNQTGEIMPIEAATRCEEVAR